MIVVQCGLLPHLSPSVHHKPYHRLLSLCKTSVVPLREKKESIYERDGDGDAEFRERRNNREVKASERGGANTASDGVPGGARRLSLSSVFNNPKIPIHPDQDGCVRVSETNRVCS
uniref:Uncharacterized protein n=1 Tax=Helianthus annuus TaxID=4232 RepID=A0A251UB61_HELAN